MKLSADRAYLITNEMKDHFLETGYSSLQEALVLECWTARYVIFT